MENSILIVKEKCRNVKQISVFFLFILETVPMKKTFLELSTAICTVIYKQKVIHILLISCG